MDRGGYRLQSMGSQRDSHDLVPERVCVCVCVCVYMYMYIYINTIENYSAIKKE